MRILKMRKQYKPADINQNEKSASQSASRPLSQGFKVSIEGEFKMQNALRQTSNACKTVARCHLPLAMALTYEKTLLGFF